MRIETTLHGVKPLLMHNIQLANPDNTWTQQISAFTKKRKKTEEDRREISRLEWMGSLYVHQGVVVIPTANVLKCFTETGKITKQGKTITRALSPTEFMVPLEHEGPSDINELWNHNKGEFRDLTLVGVGKQRVVRTRPVFRNWRLSIEWELLPEVIDYDDFAKLARQAGVVEGLGDNRVNGWGRFTVDVTQVSAQRRAA